MCDKLGHTFEDYPVLLAMDLKEAYLFLLLLVKKFVKGLNPLDPTGKKHNNDLSVLQDVTLKQLHGLEILEDSRLHIVSSCVPTTEECVDCVINMLQEDFISLQTHHHSAVSNLLSFLDTASGGVPTNKVAIDDDLTGSTNTGSTTNTLDTYAINKLHKNWKDLDFWKAG